MFGRHKESTVPGAPVDLLTVLPANIDEPRPYLIRPKKAEREVLKNGVRVRVRVVSVDSRAVRTKGGGGGDLGSTSRFSWYVCGIHVVAADGGAFEWHPAAANFDVMPRPDSFLEVVYLPDDPSTRLFTEDDWPPPPGPRGWSAGQFGTGGGPLARERELFCAGQPVPAVVRAQRHSASDTDYWLHLELDLQVGAGVQTVSREVNHCNRPIAAGAQIAVVMGAAGEVVALDTDERLTGDYGQCLVWTPPAG